MAPLSASVSTLPPHENIVKFARSTISTRPPAVTPVLAKVRDLRMAIWLTPFITDGDTRALLLQLTDAIAADLNGPAGPEVRDAA